VLRAQDHGSVTHPRRRDASAKLPYGIPEMFRRLRRATKRYTPATMFQLKDEGYDSLFEILVACIISTRTFEEVTLPTARVRFARARKTVGDGETVRVRDRSAHRQMHVSWPEITHDPLDRSASLRRSATRCLVISMC